MQRTRRSALSVPSVAFCCLFLPTAPFLGPLLPDNGVGFASSEAAAQESRRPPTLIPAPREYRPAPDLPLAAGVLILPPSDPGDSVAVRELRELLAERRVPLASSPGRRVVEVGLLRTGTSRGDEALRSSGLAFDPAMAEEGYILVADGGGVTVVGATAPGVFYGVQTMKQLVEGRGTEAVLRGARIRDWPALRYRGFHDDLSRGPVPTLEFQKKQIRTFAAHKLNVYSPYFEHTLAYRSQPLVGPPGGALTPEDVRDLVAYARRYHITVIPEQEAFGHLHHVLKYEIYRDVAETPHGHVLAPDEEESLELIREMFGEIFELFPGPFVHLGADETFELGRGRTRETVERDGIGPVYADFLNRIVAELEPSGKRFLFWGDVAVNEPDLVARLPRSLIAVAWNYWAHSGFRRYLEPFREVGMETWVAPGVSCWNRFLPNYAVALPNIRGFVAAGQRLGSTGVLNTAWDDDGEALFNQTWYGVLFGAAASWQEGASDIEAFQERFGRSFHGDTTGKIDEAYRRLIAAQELLVDAELGDASNSLFWLDPWTPEGQRVAALMAPVADSLRLLAEEALILLAEARSQHLRETDALAAMELGARKLDFLGMKFQFADEIAAMYARARDPELRESVVDELRDVSSMNGRLQDLRDGYALTRDLYEAAWRRENRPYWIHNVLNRYDLAIQLWIGRIDAMSAAWSQWRRERTLPPAEEVGIPAPRGGS